MDYYVTVLPTYDYFWQVELLIESFKMLNMQDKLLIGIPGDNVTALSPNLATHKRKFFFVDYDKRFEKSHPPINKIAGVLAALNQKALSPNFTLLHTDMVMVTSVPDNWNDNIIFHPHPVRKEVARVLKLPKEFMWIGFDGVVQFNCVPYKFFERCLLRAEALISEHGPDWPAALAAWNLTAHDYGALLSFMGAHMEAGLTSNILLPVLHYKNGMPPIFSKKSYGEMRFAEEPYDCLMKQNPTLNTDYIQHVIRSYKKTYN